ncbi:hypothetical protein T2_00043 [Ralstonia phage Elie]|uniref:Phage protein Gp138 N-terminal domain-containing protein n=4 Tax=Bakolyvirus TaxID=2843355 RepID=A0A7G5BBS2_9CAUD|nr:hypothetical protein KE332_gp43 [Ralstonia phage Adzire]YP_010052764.1 hypothetical protein KE333_gp15 [Ralstonia phage Bakoly]YP_010077730.1 hypothetical protein KMC38_gp43 [Ralstonia phage Simangalove]QMV32988.1 hypothetical protein T2_00043 [Ralstonia phage Elie]QMV33555.1 hypothetical protein 30B_00048 [Ralstonia phage Jenny]QMV33700.1 hypothetical protein S3_00056 [Ralstonia phage Sarlave]QMV32360.1 hypothetical protein S1_00043 [Ralstonia phage Adzire]QMV32588.1 hypothetical protein
MRFNSTLEEQFDPDRALRFKILQIVRGIHTAQLVKVLAVRPDSFTGQVDVQPLIVDITTDDLVVEQAPIYGVPYMRLQGGESAVILDPVVGDIGLAVFAERDITQLKSTRAEAPPNTDRAYSAADGLYLGGFLNAAPTQFVRMNHPAAGIDIVSPGAISLQAGTTVHIQSGTTTTVDAPGGFIVNANMTLNGSMSQTRAGAGNSVFAAPITTPDVILPTFNVAGHKHGGVQTGGGDTGTGHN